METPVGQRKTFRPHQGQGGAGTISAPPSTPPSLCIHSYGEYTRTHPRGGGGAWSGGPETQEGPESSDSTPLPGPQLHRQQLCSGSKARKSWGAEDGEGPADGP